MNTPRALVTLLSLTATLLGCATEEESADWMGDDESTADEALLATDTEALRAAPFYYEVRGLVTNKCLDIPWGEARAGLPVNQFACHGGPAQRFAFERVGLGNAYRLRNTSSRLCVTPQAAGAGRFTLVQTACGQTTQQQFSLDGQLPPYQLPQSTLRWVQDPAYCVDVPSGVATDGVQLQLYPCHFQSNQVFRLTGGY
jgi:hypothetical protein